MSNNLVYPIYFLFLVFFALISGEEVYREFIRSERTMKPLPNDEFFFNPEVIGGSYRKGFSIYQETKDKTMEVFQKRKPDLKYDDRWRMDGFAGTFTTCWFQTSIRNVHDRYDNATVIVIREPGEWQRGNETKEEIAKILNFWDTDPTWDEFLEKLLKNTVSYGCSHDPECSWNTPDGNKLTYGHAFSCAFATNDTITGELPPMDHKNYSPRPPRTRTSPAMTTPSVNIFHIILNVNGSDSDSEGTGVGSLETNSDLSGNGILQGESGEGREPSVSGDGSIGQGSNLGGGGLGGDGLGGENLGEGNLGGSTIGGGGGKPGEGSSEGGSTNGNGDGQGGSTSDGNKPNGGGENVGGNQDGAGGTGQNSGSENAPLKPKPKPKPKPKVNQWKNHFSFCDLGQKEDIDEALYLRGKALLDRQWDYLRLQPTIGVAFSDKARYLETQLFHQKNIFWDLYLEPISGSFMRCEDAINKTPYNSLGERILTKYFQYKNVHSCYGYEKRNGKTDDELVKSIMKRIHNTKNYEAEYKSFGCSLYPNCNKKNHVMVSCLFADYEKLDNKGPNYYQYS